jgi:hypothetical protein
MIAARRTSSRQRRSLTVGAARAAGILLLCTITTVACSSRSADMGAPPDPAPDASPTAPWQAERLPAASVPDEFTTAWSRAENRSGCALVAFTPSATAGAEPRIATFSGGWGVAYDRADLRSAFGIAGTGVDAAEPSYDDWPARMRWSDGSTAGYGPEGGSGPNELAYLRIAGQDCLYNVWSRLGRSHLEQLLASLRFVERASP